MRSKGHRNGFSASGRPGRAGAKLLERRREEMTVARGDPATHALKMLLGELRVSLLADHKGPDHGRGLFECSRERAAATTREIEIHLRSRGLL